MYIPTFLLNWWISFKNLFGKKKSYRATILKDGRLQFSKDASVELKLTKDSCVVLYESGSSELAFTIGDNDTIGFICKGGQNGEFFIRCGKYFDNAKYNYSEETIQFEIVALRSKGKMFQIEGRDAYRLLRIDPKTDKPFKNKK